MVLVADDYKEGLRQAAERFKQIEEDLGNPSSGGVSYNLPCEGKNHLFRATCGDEADPKLKYALKQMMTQNNVVHECNLAKGIFFINFSEQNNQEILLENKNK